MMAMFGDGSLCCDFKPMNEPWQMEEEEGGIICEKVKRLAVGAGAHRTRLTR